MLSYGEITLENSLVILHKFKSKVISNYNQGYQKETIKEKIKQLNYNEVEIRMYDRGGFML